MSLSIILFLLSFFAMNNLTDQKTSEIDALFAKYNGPGVPGANVMVIRNGKVIFKKAYGFADLENKIASTSSTNYRLASVTKQFTAMSILMLIEKKKLTYNTTLTDIFPGFPDYGKKITIRHLLTHTSGLRDYEDLILDSTTVPLRDKQVLELLEKQDSTAFTPGSKFSYSNSGYALLALTVEKVSGMSFAEFLKVNIFSPLKMNNTVAYEQGISDVNKRAYGYEEKSGKFIKKDQSLTSSVLGDGGIYSSVEDLFNWDQALYTSKLVSDKTLKEAFTPAVKTEDNGVSYGFGWFIEEYRGLKSVWHYGSTVGFGTAIERFPSKNFTVIVLVNRNGTVAHEIARKVVDLFLF